MKVCTKCKELKGESEFTKQSSHKDGLCSWCRLCTRASQLDYRKDPTNRIKAAKVSRDWRSVDIRRYKNSSLKSKYNISLEDYEKLLEKQNHKCAICREETSLVIDHDHKCCPDKGNSCGKCVRGLLCSNCNKALGGFKDSPEILQGAILYLT